MSLLDIRKWFVKDSGRFDLVTDLDTFADNGADKYIHAGQKWLERQVSFLNQEGMMIRELDVGEYLLPIENLRRVDNIFLRSDVSSHRLYRLSYKEIRKLFPRELSTMSNGIPSYFTLISTRQANVPADPIDDENLTLDAHDITDGILILPAPTALSRITIQGEFFTPKLNDDVDENFWTKNEPSVLVKAGLRELEAFYRNYSGVNDWTNSILQDLVGIEKDFIDKTQSHLDQMEG